MQKYDYANLIYVGAGLAWTAEIYSNNIIICKAETSPIYFLVCKETNLMSFQNMRIVAIYPE